MIASTLVPPRRPDSGSTLGRLGAGRPDLAVGVRRDDRREHRGEPRRPAVPRRGTAAASVSVAPVVTTSSTRTSRRPRAASRRRSNGRPGSPAAAPRTARPSRAAGPSGPAAGASAAGTPAAWSSPAATPAQLPHVVPAAAAQPCRRARQRHEQHRAAAGPPQPRQHGCHGQRQRRSQRAASSARPRSLNARTAGSHRAGVGPAATVGGKPGGKRRGAARRGRVSTPAQGRHSTAPGTPQPAQVRGSSRSASSATSAARPHRDPACGPEPAAARLGRTGAAPLSDRVGDSERVEGRRPGQRLLAADQGDPGAAGLLPDGAVGAHQRLPPGAARDGGGLAGQSSGRDRLSRPKPSTPTV